MEVGSRGGLEMEGGRLKVERNGDGDEETKRIVGKLGRSDNGRRGRVNLAMG